MRQLLFLLRYVKYRLAAKTPHGIHSPFVFDLLNNTILNENHFYAYGPIERLRSLLLQDSRKVNRRDLGAGSAGRAGKIQTVQAIAKNAAKAPRYGALLFRLVNRFQPAVILELGTSLGISTAYLAFANSHARVITMEGCPETVAVARENFRKLKLENVKTLTGDFKELLPGILTEAKPDFVFFDGNHRKEPTLSYFNSCLEKAGNSSVFVFDDIHWSEEMQEAWEEIKSHPRVRVTLDLFFLGIVFFNPELTKQDFVIYY